MASMYELVIGAMGGAFVLVAQHVLNRLGESHKAAVGLSAKRRERFNDKQAMIIVGLHRRLYKFVEDVSKLYFRGDEGDLDPELADIVAVHFNRKLDKAKESFKRLEAFHERYTLYLPEPLDTEISGLILFCQDHIERFEREFMTKEWAEIDKDTVEKIVDMRGRSIIFMTELKKELRDLLVDKPQPTLMAKLSMWWKRYKDFVDNRRDFDHPRRPSPPPSHERASTR